MSAAALDLSWVDRVFARDADAVRAAPGKGDGLFNGTGETIPAGEVVVAGDLWTVVRNRTTHTIQVGWDLHAVFMGGVNTANHSCDPSCLIAVHWPQDTGRALSATLVARRDIAPGEELTWDYAQTEAYSIAAPECRCGSANCRGRSMGFLELPPAERLRVRKVLGVADYLEGARP